MMTVNDGEMEREGREEDIVTQGLGVRAFLCKKKVLRLGEGGERWYGVCSAVMIPQTQKFGGLGGRR